MKQVRGFWLPGAETHLVAYLEDGPEFAGGPTYQLRKTMAAMPRVRNFRHAIDVGAHCGLWSRVLARMFTRVTAFEPMPEHRDCFALNLAGADNVKLHEFAIGNYAGTIAMQSGGTHSGSTAVQEGGEHVAQIRRLDDIMIESDPVDFIKIDCEGYEYFVLKGGEQTIRRNRPAIVVEQKYENACRYGRERTEAVDLLRDWGAKLRWDIGGDFCLSW